MTLKKQLYLLAGIIIAIPVLCVLFISISSYLHSSRRYMENEGRSLQSLDKAAAANSKQNFSVENEFEYLPPEFDAFLLSTDNEVLISTLNDIPVGRVMTRDELFDLVLDKEGRYFYQFAPYKMGEKKVMMISRTPRRTPHLKNPKNFYGPILTLVASLVAVSILMLMRISKNLFNSVLRLHKQIERIAGGNLEEPVISSEQTDTNEITYITEQLETMRKALLEAQNRKNKLIMGISHDLRTPIAIIKGYTEALEDGVISDEGEIKKTLGLINTKINHLENMVNSLINFVKLDNNEIRKNLAPKSITKLVNTFALDAKNTVSVFKRKLSTNIKLTEEYMIPYDEQLINRVFENLLSNALRYTEENDEIRICAYESESAIYIKICDTGIGISDSDLSNIFDLFYRATNSRREEGMGIGLSVVKNIIETHGWKIDVQSEKGKGSCFTIIIPLPEL